MPLTPLQRLHEEGLSVLVTRDDCDLYRSSLDGVQPLLEMIDWFPAGFSGATVADRIVGGCAARIFVYLRAAMVFAVKGSVRAEQVLSFAGTQFSFEQTIAEVRNRDNSGICPFEQLSTEHTDTRRLVAAMRAKLAGSRA